MAGKRVTQVGVWDEDARDINRSTVNNAVEHPQQGPTKISGPDTHMDAVLEVQDGSPWNAYEEGYEIELCGDTIVAERRHPASGLVTIRRMANRNTQSKLAMLRKLQRKHFVNYIEVFSFSDIIYVVSEYMAISLVEIIAVSAFPKEKHVASIIGQALEGIKFLEDHNLVHGGIIPSNILLNHKGKVKIANQDNCMPVREGRQGTHRDVQDLGQVMAQLVTKRQQDEAAGSNVNLQRYSHLVLEFISDTTVASAEELQRHAFLRNGWRQGDLLWLVSLAAFSTRRFYKVGQ